ncbi:MAG: hypothetical protein KBC46_03480 [Ferrovibrio sp.]|nr:hypothetical protein [Ferrovibrio sp.]
MTSVPQAPKRFTVAKDFATPQRRFQAGSIITAVDLDGTLGIADWERTGHLVPAPAEKAQAEKSGGEKGAKPAAPA